MRHGWLIFAAALAACGGGGSGGTSGSTTHQSPANLAGEYAFPVGMGSVGTSGPDNLTLLFQERGDAEACLPPGARSVAITLSTRDHSALGVGSYAFGTPGLDGGATDAGSSGDGGSGDGGSSASDAGASGVDVIAIYTDGDAGLIDLRARWGSVTATAISTDPSSQVANSGSFSLTFVTLDGQAHNLNGAYDLSRACQ